MGIDISKLRKAIKENPDIGQEELERLAMATEEVVVITEDSIPVTPVISESIDNSVQIDSSNDEPVSNSIVPMDNTGGKAVTDLSLTDVKVKLDNTKSAGDQIKEVIDYAATVNAVQDKGTVEQIASAKKEELVADAEVKAKGAKKESVKADTEVQRAKRAKFQLLFDTFGVADHIPDWLLKILMCIFAPFYVLFVIIVGIPTGFVRFLIDCVDGILVRYDDADVTRKPKIKVTVWVVLSLLIASAICLTLLKCFNVI